MKLKLEFTNGEFRTIEVTNVSDFKMAAGKVLMAPAVLTTPTEVFATAMIIKIEIADDQI